MADRQAALHTEIKQRYKRKKRRHVSIAALRVRDLNRLFTARYGEVLPNDDAGRDDVSIMAHHLANVGAGDPVDRIRQWVSLRAPWFPTGDLAKLIRDAINSPRRWKADRLAWRMRLTEADRATLRITTIGAIDLGRGSRIAQRRKRNRMAKEAQRRAAGIKPRHEYEAKAIARAKPWDALGMSRASWYRASKPQPVS